MIKQKLNACILLKVVPTRATLILNVIRQLEGVRKAYSTYGRFDIAVFVEVSSYQKLREITGKINTIDGVRSTETLPEA